MDINITVLVHTVMTFISAIAHLQSQEQLLLNAASAIISAVRCHKLRRLRKYQNKIKPHTRRKRSTNIPRSPQPRGIEPEQFFGSYFDCFHLTGLFDDVFEELFQSLEPRLRAPRFNQFKKIFSHNLRSWKNQSIKTSTTILSPRFRLVLVLYWLRHYPSFRDLALIFRLNSMCCWLEVQFMLPILCDHLKDQIALPGIPFHLPHNALLFRLARS